MLINELLKRWSYRILAPGVLLSEQYEALKQLLQYDIRCHEQMAEFQELLHNKQPEDFASIRKRFTIFSKDVDGMVDALLKMKPGGYTSLKSYHKKFDFYTRFLLAPPGIDTSPPYVLQLNTLPHDESRVGNKIKHLAIMQKDLGLTVPEGFAITASGYHYLIEHNTLRGVIDEHLAALNIGSISSLTQTSQQVMELIRTAEIPAVLEQEILTAYDNLSKADKQMPVAVRSSALGEDGESSFAGQFTTVLHVIRADILTAYKEVLASKYSPEALYYRIHQGWGDEEIAMSVLVMEMVNASCSGVLYTSDVFQDVEEQEHLHLHVINGIGERLVGGTASPDHYTLERQAPHATGQTTTDEHLISDIQREHLAALGIRIEKYFGPPQDIEWSIDNHGKVFILQARSLHRSAENISLHETVPAQHDHKSVIKGCERASGGIAAGTIYKLDEDHSIDDIPTGAVLVSRNTPPEYVKCIHKISAVLSVSGSRASHFATVAREFGIPFLSGIEDAYSLFAPGDTVTVDGNRGVVYEGKVEVLLQHDEQQQLDSKYRRVLQEALKFITPLELIDPAGTNFIPEGCRSLHDIIRFCHEKALHTLFSSGKPGSGRGALRFTGDIPLDVYLFDVGGGISESIQPGQHVPFTAIDSIPFRALWRGLGHPGVQWKQKPFDWDAYDRIELAGGVPPNKESFAFASYAVIGADYLHFNLRFGYHFTIVDVLCGETTAENHCMLRFAGGGGDYEHRSLRIDFIEQVLERLGFVVEKKGDLLEAKLMPQPIHILKEKLDVLGRLLGATKLMDMVLEDKQMVDSCVKDFFNGRYSFSQEG